MTENQSLQLSDKTPDAILKQVINSMTDYVFFKGLDGRYLGCNKEYERLIGKRESEIVGKTAYDLNDVELADIFTASDQKVIHSAVPIKIEVWLKTADGTRTLFENTKSPLFDNNGSIIGILGVFRDITKQKEAEAAVKASEEKYRLITENTLDTIWLYNLHQDRFTYYSPSVQQLRGLTASEAAAEKILDTVTPEFRDVVSNKISEIKNHLIDHPETTRSEFMEIKQPTRSGDSIWVEISAKSSINDQNEIEILGVSRNIEDRKKAENEILYLGYHDQLTGLYNRHYFEMIINEEMDRSDRYGEPLSMLLLDLDHFKTVNDTWGHPIGDELILLTTRVMKDNIRVPDTLVRFGGEEFVILMPQTDNDNVVEAAEKIRIAIEKERHPVAGCRTVSIGVAQRMSNESFRHWYRRVDEALYLAKESGRNRVVASDENKIFSSDAVRLSWQPEWESGNSEIDRQHKELIEIANSLINMSFAGKGSQDAEPQVEQLLRHIVNHFETEEKILEAAGFPDFLTHAKIHKNLNAKALRLNESFKNGEVKATAFFSFVVDDVVLDHLMKVDTKFFPFTRGSVLPSV